MKPIRMVDLLGQYHKIKSEIDHAIMDVVEQTAFINGSYVSDFSENLENYLNVKHVIPCANGTDALQIAMMALDLQPDDEVITAPFTFIATAEVISLLKLKPVFVDVDYHTFNINTDLIEKAITNKTKAILPVHLFGQSANMEEIMNISKKYNLYVIEDNCQAIGADFKFSNGKTQKAGTIGHVGCTSFFPSKNLGCFGDGGAIFTNDDQLADKMKMIVNHGMKIRYYHDIIGVNSRLDTIQAAVLNVKLKYLDDYIHSRQNAAAFYNEHLSNHPNIETPHVSEFSTHVYHQYTLKINNADRNELQKYLANNNIPAMIYYPVPLHLQKAFHNSDFTSGMYPVSEQLCEIVLSLPMHTELDEEQLSYICRTILNYAK